MESINKLHELMDSNESPTLSLRDLPLHNNGIPSQTNHSFSPPHDFSFPLPTAADENNSFMPNLTPFVHRRAESLDMNGGGALAVDCQRLRRARTNPRPTPVAGRRRMRWPFLALGSLKHPVEMEIRDMRSRRRRPPDVAECCGHGNCWRIIGALSCKAAESTAVAPLDSTVHPPLASTCIGLFGKDRK